MGYEREPWEWGEGKRYYGKDPEPTEQFAGEEMAKKQPPKEPLKPGGPGHRLLSAWHNGDLMTSYDASKKMTGDWHAIRREAERLEVRELIVQDGELPNHAPHGMPSVKAYRLTGKGDATLTGMGRLGFEAWDV